MPVESHQHSLPVTLPPFGTGQRIGLFGGSFDPAHEGHRHVALTALRRLDLDWVWVLVTPGNPLKNTKQLASITERSATLQKLMHHPRIIISTLEQEAGFTYSFETLSFLKNRAPNAKFVWLMGADNLAGFNRWKGWSNIASLMPIAIIDRPGNTFSALHSKMAQRFALDRILENDAKSLADKQPPAWVFLHDRQIALSSTQIRRTLKQSR